MLFLQAHHDHTEFLSEETNPSNQQTFTDLPMPVLGKSAIRDWAAITGCKVKSPGFSYAIANQLTRRQQLG